MKYSVEEISPVQRKVNVTVPVEEVNAAIGATIAIYRRDADIKGFRKGKVPGKLVESKFRDQIYNEATTDLVNVHINEIMNELNLLPLSRIDMDGGTLVRDQEFSYTFTFEISPEFDLPEYKGLEVEEEEVSVSEEETQAVIDRIRENVAVPAIVREERVPQTGDIVSVDFQAYEGYTALQGIAAQNFDFRLGMGDALPQFEEIVLDMLPGQTKKQDITFPQDFINESLAGKSVTMEVTLHAIKEKILPELNDDLAQKAGGYENLEQLKEAITKSYTASRKEVSKSVAQKALLDQVKAQTDFELPASLVGSHIDRMLEEFKEKLERQGKSPASQNKTPEQLRKEFKPEAESLVRSQLVLLAIAQKEDLKVQPQEVDAYLRRLAMSTGQDFNALKDFYESKNLIVALKDKILADKAMDLVYAHAKVTMIPPTSETKPENQDADS